MSESSATLLVRPARKPLRGSVPVPSDKSIAHRSLIFAALSRGTSELRGFSYGEDNVATLRAFQQMGVRSEDDGHGTLRVTGVGLDGLRPPSGPLDCGNSGTTMRLLTGLLAAQPFATRLFGDESLSRRPMGRVARPLIERGAVITGQPHPTRPGDLLPPLELGPSSGGRLRPCEVALSVASAQVKSALLLSGLTASGPTRVSEPFVSRDHTERMMAALGLPLRAAGAFLELHPPRDPGCIPAFALELPGDLSAAAFLLAAGLLVPGSAVTTRHTGLNPTRSGFIELARQLGGAVATRAEGERLGEPVGEVTSVASALRGGTVGGELALRALDEIPIACALAARAEGVTEFHDLAELRVKESDRIATMASVLGAFGLDVEERPDGLCVEGRPEGALRAARVASRGDHRIAMTAAVLGLVADGETVIEDVDCIATSFPRFVGTLRALGADLEVVS